MDKKKEAMIIHDRNSNGLSYRKLVSKYGVPITTIYRMLNSKVNKPLNAEATTGEEPPMADDIKALKEALRLERLKNELLNNVIDIASKELGVDIRKKSGTRRSK